MIGTNSGFSTVPTGTAFIAQLAGYCDTEAAGKLRFPVICTYVPMTVNLTILKCS